MQKQAICSCFCFSICSKQLGRFLSIDPLADAGGQQTLSPYHAMGCNPVLTVDPLGLMGDPFTRGMPFLQISSAWGSESGGPRGSNVASSLGADWDNAGAWAILMSKIEEALANRFDDESGFATNIPGGATGAMENSPTSSDATGDSSSAGETGGDGETDGPLRKTAMQFVNINPMNEGKNIDIASPEDLKRWYPDGKNKIEGYSDECMIRFSYILAATGTDISTMKSSGFSVSPKGYLRAARDGALWMLKDFGPPMAGTATSKWTNDVKVLTVDEFDKIRQTASGIVYFEFTFMQKGQATGTGHMDFWHQATTGTRGGENIFYQAQINPLYYPGLVIWYWPLK